jgi:uncharacterized glyoxalase superfamily protein PhnB
VHLSLAPSGRDICGRDFTRFQANGATDMPTTPVVVVPRIRAIAPQLLVDDLDRAVAYYRDRLGFVTDFVYQSFYAGMSRDGAPIHLKCAPKAPSDRTHRNEHEHLDAYIDVSGLETLFAELRSRGATIVKPLEQRPWACRDFYVEDVDGYLLCFSEQTA